MTYRAICLCLLAAAIVLSPSVAIARRCGDSADSSVDALSPIDQLKCLARSGDKRAQLELGIRYENGSDVVRDLRRAKRLYDQAAQNSVMRIYVYSPAVGGERYGRVIALDRPPSPGIPQAAKLSAHLAEELKKQ